MLDVEFDFFDPQPHDYHSIKLLLAQLLSHDAKNLELEGVVNLVLEQKLVGSTVKTDGAEGDPYAVLTVLNLNVHKVSPPSSSDQDTSSLDVRRRTTPLSPLSSRTSSRKQLPRHHCMPSSSPSSTCPLQTPSTSGWS